MFMCQNRISLAIIILLTLNNAQVWSQTQNIVKLGFTNSYGEEGYVTGFVIGKAFGELHIATVLHDLPNVDTVQFQVTFYQENTDGKEIVKKIKAKGKIHRIEGESRGYKPDLAFVKLTYPEDVKQFKFGKLKFQRNKKLKEKKRLFVYGHPISSFSDNPLAKLEVKLKKAAEELSDPFFLTTKGDISNGYSGGPVFLKSSKKMLGMVLSNTNVDATVLKAELIYKFAEEERIFTDMFGPQSIPQQVKLFGYSGVGVLGGALAARLLADAHYKDYREYGERLTDEAFEEKFDKTKAEFYNRANDENKLAYISFGIGAVLVATATVLFFKEENEIYYMKNKNRLTLCPDMMITPEFVWAPGITLNFSF